MIKAPVKKGQIENDSSPRFDFKHMCTDLDAKFEEIFPTEFKFANKLFDDAFSKGNYDRYGFDVFGQNLVESPVTLVLRDSENTNYVSTLLYKIADYFENRMQYDFSKDTKIGKHSEKVP